MKCAFNHKFAVSGPRRRPRGRSRENSSDSGAFALPRPRGAVRGESCTLALTAIPLGFAICAPGVVLAPGALFFSTSFQLAVLL